MKPTKVLPCQPLLPAGKAIVSSRKFQKTAPEINKHAIKEKTDIKRKHDNKALLETTKNKEIKDPQHAIILEFESKLKPNCTTHAMHSKNSAQSNSKQYNPKQFSSNKTDEVQKPVENKKMSVEEIQKKLKKWRIQRDMKTDEKNLIDYCSGDNKSNFIFTKVPKFILEKKKCADVGTYMHDNLLDTNVFSNKVKSIDTWTNSSKIKCVFPCVDLSDRKHQSTDAQSTNMKHESSTVEPLKVNKAMHHVSIQADLNENVDLDLKHDDSLCKQNDVCTNPERNQCSNALAKDNPLLLIKDNSDSHKLPKKILIPEDRKQNQKININEEFKKPGPTTKTKCDKRSGNKRQTVTTEAVSNSKSFTACITSQTKISPEESIIEKHKKSIYALVDLYLKKTQNNPRQSMDNFMKYIIDNIESSKDNPLEAIDQFNKLYLLQPGMNNTSEFSTQEKKDEDMKEREHRNAVESSTAAIKNARINQLTHKENSRSSLKLINNKASLLKKEKFKTLTLVNPKQNEKLCIHINYQPHRSPDAKSKLTIHRESHINIKPHLTKHTFTTATCYPQHHSSRPNICTQYFIHLDEGGCKEIIMEEEKRVKVVHEHSGTMALKKGRLSYIIRCLIRHVKLNIRLSNRMTSIVCEKLLSAQEFLCSYYSNQHADLNTLSPISRQIITLLILEVDNPDDLNLNVNTNKNFILILQLIVENIRSLHNSKNMSGPPPLVQVNNTNTMKSSLPRRPVNSKIAHEDISCPSPKRMNYHLHPRRRFRNSFGMNKSYLNKKVRCGLDRPLLNVIEKSVNTLLARKGGYSERVSSRFNETFKVDEEGKNKEQSPEASKLKAESREATELKTKSTEASTLKAESSRFKQSSTDDVYESDWATPSSSTLPCSSSDEKSISTIEPKSLLPEASNLAGIKIRLQDLNNENNKEHYRISVKTVRDSVIRGMQPKLPSVISSPDVVHTLISDHGPDIEATPVNSETNIVDENSWSNNKDNGMKTTENKIDPDNLSDYGKNSEASSIKSRTNFTNNDKSYVDSVLLSLSKPDFNEIPLSHPSVLYKNDLLAESNSCGDNNLITGTHVWPIELEQSFLIIDDMKSKQEIDKVNKGVNTDVSLLENLRSWHYETGDSYACDLSLCFSTTENELSEGEIGLSAYTRQKYHCFETQSSECTISNNSDPSMRNTRRRNVQHTAGYFLT